MNTQKVVKYMDVKFDIEYQFHDNIYRYHFLEVKLNIF